MTEQVKRIDDLTNAGKLPLQDYECLKHGPYTAQPVVFRLGDFEKIFEPFCPICEAEMKKRDEEQKEERERRAVEAARQRKIERLRKMNIGSKFWDESLETFDPYTPELQRHLDICRAFSENPQGRMLVMLGKNGNGKNHLAASLLKLLGGYMYSVFEIELLLKRSYSHEVSEWKIYRQLYRAPLVVINEIGKHKIGDWEMNFLSYIINKRYENMMPIVLISNGHLRDNCPKAGCPECFQNYFGNDVISRILEAGEIMLFTGEDYRMKLREKRFEG
jgi:DNA replication protein DnaC